MTRDELLLNSIARTEAAIQQMQEVNASLAQNLQERTAERDAAIAERDTLLAKLADVSPLDLPEVPPQTAPDTNGSTGALVHD